MAKSGKTINELAALLMQANNVKKAVDGGITAKEYASQSGLGRATAQEHLARAVAAGSMRIIGRRGKQFVYDLTPNQGQK
jgi:Fic family protein